MLALPLIVFYAGLLQAMLGPRLMTAILEPNESGEASALGIFLVVISFGMFVFGLVAWVVVTAAG